MHLGQWPREPCKNNFGSLIIARWKPERKSYIQVASKLDGKTLMVSKTEEYRDLKVTHQELAESKKGSSQPQSRILVKSQWHYWRGQRSLSLFPSRLLSPVSLKPTIVAFELHRELTSWGWLVFRWKPRCWRKSKSKEILSWTKESLFNYYSKWGQRVVLSFQNVHWKWEVWSFLWRKSREKISEISIWQLL